MTKFNSQPDNDDLTLPDELVAALRDATRADQTGQPVSTEIDQQIHAKAQSHFNSEAFTSPRTRQRKAWLKWSASGVAAALLLGVGLIALNPLGESPQAERQLAESETSAAPDQADQQPGNATRQSGEPSVADANDINNDGLVDIIDVYVLAAAVQIDDTSKMPDLTGDGLVTQADADQLVQRIVRLPDGKNERGAGG